MICPICRHEAIPHNSQAGIAGDVFRRLSWELVYPKEYQERLEDGRSTHLLVCSKCYTFYTGEPAKPIGELLSELNEKRKEAE